MSLRDEDRAKVEPVREESLPSPSRAPGAHVLTPPPKPTSRRPPDEHAPPGVRSKAPGAWVVAPRATGGAGSPPQPVPEVSSGASGGTGAEPARPRLPSARDEPTVPGGKRLQQLLGGESPPSAASSVETPPATAAAGFALPWPSLLPLLTGFVGAASGALMAVLIARAVVPVRVPGEPLLDAKGAHGLPPAASSNAVTSGEYGEPPRPDPPSTGKSSGQRSLEQALEGMWRRQDQRREELVALTRELERTQPRSRSQLRRLRALADDPLLLPDVLTAMARLSGPESADLVYDVWMSSRDREEVARAAEALAYSNEVRAKSSPSLRVALDLAKAQRCEDSLRLLKDAKQHGDRRSLRALVALTRRAPGCPENRFGDCNACVRRGTDLRDAIAAARERRPPSFR